MREGGAKRQKPKAERRPYWANVFAIAVFVAIAITLENAFGIAFRTTFLVVCAVGCLALIAWLGWEYRTERWPWVALVVATLFNIGLFFSPLAHLPLTKGDLLVFLAPDAAIVLTARLATYRVETDAQRAVRRQLILLLVATLVFSAIVMAFVFSPPRAG